MQVELTIMFEDIEKYNRGEEVIAAARGRAASLVLENFKMQGVIDVSIDVSEVLRREEKTLGGMSPGKYPYYVIQKKGLDTYVPGLDVQTPIGYVSAKYSGNANYPGIFIDVEGTDLVLVEYDKIKEKHVIRVWDHENPDDDCVYMQVINPND